MLVLGAGSGVGLAAVDIGAALGLRVIAAASTPEKRALAESRGAMATIDNSTLDAAGIKDAAKAGAPSGSPGGTTGSSSVEACSPPICKDVVSG